MDQTMWIVAAGLAALAVGAALWSRRRVTLSSNANWAPCYDFKTKAVSYVPREKLKPGWVQARIHNLEGVFWVDPTQMKGGDKYAQPPLDGAALAAVRELVAQLGEVHPLTLEQWEDRLRRGADPAAEIARWQRVSSCYRRECDGRSFNLPQKRDVLAVVLACLEAGADGLAAVRLDALAKTTAEQIASRVGADRQPLSAGA
jgi:hypothetical protein